MDYINSYVRAKEFYRNKFVPERQRVIQHLKKLRDGIQIKTKYQKVGCVLYSTAGVGSGLTMLFSLAAAPATGGVSVMAYGYCVGMTSGVVDIVHRCLKWASIRKLVGNAEFHLREHEATFSDLKQIYLQKLKEDIDTIRAKIETIRMIKCDEEKEIMGILYHLQDIGLLIAFPKNMEKFINILIDKNDFIFHLLLSDSLVCRCLSLAAKHIAYSKTLAKEGVKESAKDFSKACAVASVGVGIVLDLKSLILSCNDLTRFSEGELCDEAEKLNSLIKKMEYELENLDKWFDERSNE